MLANLKLISPNTLNLLMLPIALITMLLNSQNLENLPFIIWMMDQRSLLQLLPWIKQWTLRFAMQIITLKTRYLMRLLVPHLIVMNINKLIY